jgi:DNA-binding NarL/FixJ family response regulator
LSRAFHKSRSIHTDTGCEYHSQCLTCPFPVCIKHEGPTKAQIKAHLKRRAVLESMDEGFNAEFIAVKLGLKLRTVQRIIQEGFKPLAGIKQ